MRMRTAILCFTVAAVAFGGGVWLGTDLGKEPAEVTLAAPEEENPPSVLTAASPAPTLPPRTPAPTPAAEKEEYLLMLSGESICIYALIEDGKTELIQKTEVDTGQLRQEDYENLCRGLTVESLEKARSLCEDFGN